MKKILSLAGALALCVSFPAQSAIVHLAGTTVDFYYDDAQPGMAVYGELTAVGDSIFATPTDFTALSENGGTVDTPALGTVQVVARSGYAFDSVVVAQQGDYQMNGSGSAVSTSADLTVDSNSSAASTTTALTSSDNFGLQDNLLHEWASSATIDLTTAIWTGIMDIDLTLDSMLSASTLANGEYALIQNKFVGGGLVTIMTTPIPLPASVWLLASGLLGLVGIARRKV